MRLITPEGYVSLPYQMLTGFPWMNLEQTRIEIPTEAWHRYEGSWRLGSWLVVIRGKRLEPVFDQLNVAKREWTHPGDGLGDDAQVEGVTIEPLEG
jgi:hypothetical protein